MKRFVGASKRLVCLFAMAGLIVLLSRCAPYSRREMEETATVYTRQLASFTRLFTEQEDWHKDSYACMDFFYSIRRYENFYGEKHPDYDSLNICEKNPPEGLYLPRGTKVLLWPKEATDSYIERIFPTLYEEDYTAPYFREEDSYYRGSDWQYKTYYSPDDFKYKWKKNTLTVSFSLYPFARANHPEKLRNAKVYFEIKERDEDEYYLEFEGFERENLTVLYDREEPEGEIFSDLSFMDRRQKEFFEKYGDYARTLACHPAAIVGKYDGLEQPRSPDDRRVEKDGFFWLATDTPYDEYYRILADRYTNRKLESLFGDVFISYGANDNKLAVRDGDSGDFINVTPYYRVIVSDENRLVFERIDGELDKSGIITTSGVSFFMEKEDGRWKFSDCGRTRYMRQKYSQL